MRKKSYHESLHRKHCQHGKLLPSRRHLIPCQNQCRKSQINRRQSDPVKKSCCPRRNRKQIESCGKSSKIFDSRKIREDRPYNCKGRTSQTTPTRQTEYHQTGSETANRRENKKTRG